MFNKDNWVLQPDKANIFVFNNNLNLGERVIILNNSSLITQDIYDFSLNETITLNIKLNLSRNIPKNTQIDVFLIEIFNDEILNEPHQFTYKRELVGSRVSFIKSNDNINTSFYGKIDLPNTIRNPNFPEQKRRYYLLAFKIEGSNCSYSSVHLQPNIYIHDELTLNNSQMNNILTNNNLDLIVYPAINIYFTYSNNTMNVIPTPLEV